MPSRDSNPRSRQSNGCRPTPWTARLHQSWRFIPLSAANSRLNLKMSNIQTPAVQLCVLTYQQHSNWNAPTMCPHCSHLHPITPSRYHACPSSAAMFICTSVKTHNIYVDCVWNVMAHAQKPNFVSLRNGRVHLNWRERQFSRLLAAEVCASAVVMLDTLCSEVVWRVMVAQSIRPFPLQFPPVRHRVPSHFNWILPTHLPSSWLLYLKCLKLPDVHTRLLESDMHFTTNAF